MSPESGEETASFLDWKRAHAELERLAKTRAEFDAEEGQWLLYALRSGRARAGAP